MALTACLQQTTEPLNNNDIVAGIINNTSTKESSVEQNPDITAEDSTLCSSNDNVNASGGGPEDFQRYYPDELFNLYNLSKLVTWDEIYAAEKTLLENNEYFYILSYEMVVYNGYYSCKSLNLTVKRNDTILLTLTPEEYL